MTASGTLQTLHGPLTEWHRAHGARMATVDGGEVPGEFSAAVAEHRAVRARAGLFDRSVIGYIEIAGADALAAVQHCACSDAASLDVGGCQPAVLATPEGTVHDVVRVCRLAQDHFLLRVSPGRAVADLAWLLERAPAGDDLAVLDTSHRYATVSLQGPASAEVLRAVTDVDLLAIDGGRFEHGEIAGVRATLFRAGEVGEDGFECLLPRQPAAVRAWEALLAAGRAAGLVPAGFQAHESLRLEAAVPRYGCDLDDTTTVLEAGLGGLVGWHKAAFVGKTALEQERAHGVRRALAGFELIDPGVACRGDGVHLTGAPAGRVTSAGEGPTVDRSIGLAYLPVGANVEGTELEISREAWRARARVVPLPFYTRSKG